MSLPIASAIAVTGLMTSVWLLSLLRKDAGIVDIFWGLGFSVVAWTAFQYSAERGSAAWLLLILTSVWAVRLSLHLAIRNHGQPEDFRYRAMRARWGSAFPIASLFVVFGLQGVVMWLVSLPIQQGIAQAGTVNPVVALSGTIVWSIGLFFESVGDLQLARFKTKPDNQGNVLNTGLWKYTRHPNYFGDCMVWWGLFLVAYSMGAEWWTIVSPLTMSYLLLRVSGVTMLERTLKETKTGYRDYVLRTNAFFPGLPRKATKRQ